jgi:hypothetical protein
VPTTGRLIAHQIRDHLHRRIAVAEELAVELLLVYTSSGAVGAMGRPAQVSGAGLPSE